MREPVRPNTGAGASSPASASVFACGTDPARYIRLKLTRSARAARDNRTGIEIKPKVMYPRQMVLAISVPVRWD